MRIVTGERAVTGDRGFNPSWQRHVSAYRLTAHLLPDGLVADVGCGVGHSFPALQRPTIGFDLAPEALKGQARPCAAADLRALPVRTGSVQGLISSHSIEHVPDPERGVAEFARVLAPEGTALVITPNRLTFGRPDEVIDPYHFLELDPQQLRDLCATAFAEVTVLGVCGSETYQQIVAEERRTLDFVLALDFLRLRRFVPRRVLQLLYDLALTLSRRKPDAKRLGISEADFTLRDSDLDSADDLVAVCRRPLRTAVG
jgi:SAM-dependent methyltransferase